MTYTLTKANFFCEPSTIFEATTIFYYDFLAYSHHGGFVFTKNTMSYNMYVLNIFVGTKTYILGYT